MMGFMIPSVLTCICQEEQELCLADEAQRGK